MWIFTKKYGSYNLDNYDHVAVILGNTCLIKEGKPSRPVSNDDVQEIIRDAIRRGDNYVEVE